MKSRESELIYIYLFIDLIILNLSVLVMVGIKPAFVYPDYYSFVTYLLHANASWILSYFILSKKNLYLREGYFNRVRRIVSNVFFFIMVALILAYFFMPRSTYSRVFLLEYTTLFLAGKLLFYYLFYNYLKALREKGIHVNRAIIVGLNETGHLLHKLIECNPILGYKFIGFVSDNDKDLTEVLGKTEELDLLIKEHQVEIIFVTLTLFNESVKSKEFLRLCNRTGVRLRFVPENQQWFKDRKDMDSLGRLMLINPQEIPLDNLELQLVKRLFDIFISFLVIVFILSWLIPLISIFIKANSKGPVFFVQERTGMNNKSFKCLKFRSMQVNKDADEKQASKGDTRITLLGHFLRQSNLDEFPQFINVLFGQMSIVGPRPHMLKHTDQYSELIENYLVRHYVKPGITGWAQVSGYRGETDELWKMEKRVEYDMAYLENWNFWWDIKIVILTVLGKKARRNAL